MHYKFNITDNDNSIEKELAFAEAYGYESFVRNGESFTPNPETVKEFCERTLKRIFLEPWARKKAMAAYEMEFNNKLGD